MLISNEKIIVSGVPCSEWSPTWDSSCTSSDGLIIGKVSQSKDDNVTICYAPAAVLAIIKAKVEPLFNQCQAASTYQTSAHNTFKVTRDKL